MSRAVLRLSRCVHCDYDLAGHDVNPPNCPECGAEMDRETFDVRLRTARYGLLPWWIAPVILAIVAAWCALPPMRALTVTAVAAGVILAVAIFRRRRVARGIGVPRLVCDATHVSILTGSTVRGCWPWSMFTGMRRVDGVRVGAPRIVLLDALGVALLVRPLCPPDLAAAAEEAMRRRILASGATGRSGPDSD
jgi:hypothetical protein